MAMRQVTGSLLLQVCCLLLVLPDIWAFFGLTSREPVLTLTPNFEERMRELQQGHEITSGDLCNMLVLQKKQKRQCRRGRGVAETLVRASRLSALECQHQFQNERWNCTLGDYRKHILRKGFKETSFLYAVSSAALVHEVARACAQGVMDRCTCDESKHLENTQTWRWGGCGDNIRFGVKFTRRFLQEGRRTEKDMRALVDEHNSEAGIKTVKDLVNTTCKCHGVSGSCTVRTCWLQLSPFKLVGGQLKSKYEESVRAVSFSNQAAGIGLMKEPSNYDGLPSSLELPEAVAPVKKSELTFIDSSPNFCLNSSYSPGTSGRSCNKGQHCDTVCCGRGHNVLRQVFQRRCKCETVWCCELRCKVCSSEEEVYLCK